MKVYYDVATFLQWLYHTDNYNQAISVIALTNHRIIISDIILAREQ